MRWLVLLAPAACLVAIAGLLLYSPVQRVSRDQEPAKLTESDHSDTEDRTGDLRNCPIHAHALVLEQISGVPLEIWPLYSWEYLEASRKVFPHASNGLGSFLSDQKWVLVCYCPECRRYKIEWSEPRTAEDAQFTADFNADVQRAKDVGDSGAVAALLIERLGAADRNDHGVYLKELEKLGPDAEPAIPLLVEILLESRWVARFEASKVLGAIGAASILPVAQALAEKGSPDWHYAIDRLGDFGPKAKSTVPGLRHLLAERTGNDRIDLAYVLVKIDDDQDALAVLIEGAFAEELAIRENAVTKLLEIGEPAASSVSALIRAIDDERWTIQLRAVEALGRFGWRAEAEAAIPRLRELAEGSGPVQEAAQTALTRITSARKWRLWR